MQLDYTCAQAASEEIQASYSFINQNIKLYKGCESMNKEKILVVGGVSYDSIIQVNRFPEPENRTYQGFPLHETVGSTGSGKALNLNRLGMDVRLHGIIGNDVYGKLIEKYFDEEDLKFHYDVIPEGTQRHINMMDATGGRISYMLNVTFEPVFDREKLERKMDKCDHIVLNIINYCRHVIPYAKEHNKTIWTDLHDYDGLNPYHQDFVDSADYITVSSDKLPDYRSFMQNMIERGKKLVVCTHGKEGSTALTPDGQWIDIPIMKDCPMVDTNGAGDSFFAGLMYGILNGFDVEKSMKLGTVAAGLCVQSKELFDTSLSERKLLKVYKNYFRESL